MASSGKGLPFIGKMNEFLDRVLHPTINKTGNSKASVDVRNIGYYKDNLIPLVVEVGSDNNIVKLTAHGAVVGDLFRLRDSVNGIQEYDVVIDEIVDANTFKLAGYLSANLVAGDTFDLYKPTYERFTADGASLASVDSPPIKYNRKVGGVSIPTEVLQDQDTPSLSRPLPVVLHGLDSANITVTSNELNIASNHVNDSVAIGNGVDKIAGITASNELKVNDAPNGSKLDTIHTDLGTLHTDLTSIHSRLSDQAQYTRISDGTNVAAVTAANELKVNDAPVKTALDSVNTNLKGFVDPNNSSTIALAGTAVFTGAAIEITDFSSIHVAVATDVPSATNGLSFQFSPDGTNWDHKHEYDVTANGVSYSQSSELRYFRIVYTNGATPQGFFRLTTILKKQNVQPSRYTFDQPVIGTQLADTCKTVIFGKTTGGGGGYVAAKVTPSGAFTVESTVTSSALPTGASTEAKQDIGNTSLANLDTNLGAKADASAGSDTGTFSLISLFKRLLERFELLKQQLPASLGAKAGSASLSVVPASDAVFVTSNKSESAGAISSNRITLATAGVQYRATVSGSAPVNRKKIIIKPNKDNLGSIWIGNSSVSTTTGVEFIGPDRMEFLFDNNDYYLVSDQNNQIVEILEVY